MSVFVAVDQIDKVFNLTGGGQYIALKGIDLEIKKGEFVSLIGHSGCGKSTLLNMIAGLDLPSEGVVTLEGQRISKPGPDRMVVFQNYSLLPWRTVRENITLAVDSVMRGMPQAERKAIVEKHIDMVGLRPHADKQPAMLSGGQKQRVAIARALAIRPKLLLLDEPFGALDALTRGNLQEQLMQICEENQVTAVMVTHDVDEAVMLSDRIVMLTNGPASKIGDILEVDIPRPRKRMEVVKHPSYYSLRSEMIYFLNQQKRVKKIRARKTAAVARHGLEKVNLEIGFLPLTACAPLAVAKEKGFFTKHGLDQVNLVRETSWRGIVDGIVGGYIDAAQMPSGMPMWLTLGGHNNTPVSVVTSLTMTRNGNAITLAKRFYDQGVVTLSDFKDYLLRTREQRHIMGVVHTASMHNLLLRYWLAAGGIDPDLDVDMKIIPPAQMVADLKAGTINGYCVGEPWNYRAAEEGLGFTIATDLEVWLGHPGKVLGVREDWAEAYPNTYIALTKALLEACQYCAKPENAEEITKILASRDYVSTDLQYIQLENPNSGTCDINHPLRQYAHHQFYSDSAINRPSRTEQMWIMSQLARWGDTAFPRNWVEIVERLCSVRIFSTAARELGLDISYTRQPIQLFDGTPFNTDDPIAYLNSLKIKRDVSVAEVILDSPTRKVP
ncbi:ABC transporter ATP-binding/substrate-binding protein [Umezakia ovalisporum]|uniref:Nitrate ABC transporter ATP-binding protein n=2 Tax=Umezakia ovalisporum TaxID=75695 RepID=A0AA43GW23_9CYAN|nr:nitrate ABC transporter ATP-binding protein [Umezakia ovalisporum]MDH6055858.1 nitrate ABC transporter ATP-binding protein [Umezakia ovalisporum FSS-43]MDH6062506.1 nitrate ABC transporter ATP-binding protein [Umezakia ovalisporum FSS-62]MDH6069343.1 nitrate ABC transporter ATP-binding protein [Umezakia ovalisporum CobakiLakeA]MDH6076006.1 nitrate ABC transporter ATP-binding protein [Umezakia ovalisporum CS-1034]MDH6082162.1 nitrate ABC transporter ATP-binding protein [Umezakia ovalisporum 